MRILGSIDHPSMKITVFQNDGRFPVQFELGGLTQTYRFRQGEGINHLGDVRRVIDAEFQSKVLRQFAAMRSLHQELVERNLPAAFDDELPQII